MSGRIAQLERLDAQGNVQQAWDIAAWPVRLGRGLDQQIAWPDPHLAAHHLTLDVDAQGQLVLQAAQSVNGVQVNGAAALAQQVLKPGATWQAGASHWRVRREGEALPAEQPLHALASGVHALQPTPWRMLSALAVAVFGWELATLWLDQNPGSTWNAYVTPLMGIAAALTVWVLVWGLASKLFTHRYTVWPHLRIVLMYLLATSVIEALSGVLAYAFDAPALARWAGPLTIAVGAAMLAHHLRVVLPAQARLVNTAVAAMAVAGMGVVGALNWQRMDRLMPYQHLSTLPPPMLRVASPQPMPVLMEQLRGLEAPLQAAAQRAKEEDDPSLDDLE
jgi:hypothetical protein